MVSGFFTSPCDHEWIFSGDASEILSALNDSGFFGFSKRLKRSSITIWVSFSALGGAAALVFEQLDVESQTLQFLHHDVERLGQPRLEHVLTFDDRLVHAGAAGNVVGLHGQHLLEAE